MPTRYGGKVLDITVDGSELGGADSPDARQYQHDVVTQLRTTLDVYGGGAYKTGRWVMEELNKKLTIKPSLAQKYDANGQGVVDPQRHPVMIPDLNDSAQATDPARANVTSHIYGLRGLGSDVVIRYSPTVWWYVDARRVGVDARKHRYVQLAPDERFFLCGDKTGPQPDDILLHEMFHAYRQMNGLWLDSSKATFDPDYGSKEEFFAVMIANIYVSERNTTYQPRALRGKYTFKADGTEPLFRDLENDPKNQDSTTHHFSVQRFYDRFEDAITELVSDMSNRFRDRLASVQAQFNPIALWAERHPNGVLPPGSIF
jgi:hypothetical protein